MTDEYNGEHSCMECSADDCDCGATADFCSACSNCRYEPEYDENYADEDDVDPRRI